MSVSRAVGRRYVAIRWQNRSRLANLCPVQATRVDHLRILRRRGAATVAAAMLLSYLIQPCPAAAKDGSLRRLTGAEKSAVVGGSVALGIVAKLIPAKTSDSTRCLAYRPNAIDRWWRNALRGQGRPTNFLDNGAGSLIAPVAGGLALALLDINKREFSRDIPFFVSGAIATGAITDIAKRVFDRPRPYCQDGAASPGNRAAEDGYHTESFFSGHSSQAFFAAGFVNNRLRRHMRQEWRREEYRSWRWAPPLLTFGWAAVVGGSRIQADKHYFTDVLAGALVGYGLSEVFYRLCYEPSGTQTRQASSLFSITIAL